MVTMELQIIVAFTIKNNDTVNYMQKVSSN